MTSYIPGQGSKKPLNMMEAPIYPDIKKNPIEFKWSKKHWTVDVGQTLLDTEANTQLLEDAILSKSYRDNIDSYGQSSHQEKITVFRPPLQNYYEDFGPLNRLPTKITAIVPRNNPGTTDSAGGTTAYKTNNMVQQEVNRYITDKPTNLGCDAKFYRPLDLPLDNSVLPDLITTIPNRSLTSGYKTNINVDAYNPKSDYINPITNIPNLSYHSNYEYNYTTPINEHYSDNITLNDNTPKTSIHSGYNTITNIDGENQNNNIYLADNHPKYSVSSSQNNYIMIDGDNNLNKLQLNRTLPTSPISSGFNSNILQDGETMLSELMLESQINTPLSVVNPSSEFGYQTQIESYTPAKDHIKLYENPRVPVAAHSSFMFGDDHNIKSNRPNFHGKLQPIKSYNSGLDKGTVKTSGIEHQKVGGKYFSNRKTVQV